MRLGALVVCAVLSWVPAHARAGLLLDGGPTRSPTVHLLGSEPLRLASADGGLSKIGGDPGVRAAFGVVLALFIGFGVGHFAMADVQGGYTFLALELLDLLAIVGTVVGWAFAPTTAALANLVVLGLTYMPWLLIGFAVVRVWEIVDAAIKAAILSSKVTAEVISPAGGSPAFALATPAAANALSFRF